MKKGYIFSKESRDKMRKSHVGKKHSDAQKKKIAAKSRAMWSDPVFKEKMKAIHKNGDKHHSWKGGKPKCLDCGKLLKRYKSVRCVDCHYEFNQAHRHYNWHGGKSFEPYGTDFNNALKRQVRKRDNYTCQECNYTEEKLGYKLHSHHIDYDKTNNIIENLISLCRSCHTQTNFTRDSWKEYFNNKLQCQTTKDQALWIT